MHRQREIEKVNDFKGTLIRLFKNLDKWKYLLVLSILFATTAAILATIAPKRLATITDIISEGIKPRTENFERIRKEIINHSTPVGNKNSLTGERVRLEFNDFELDGVLITREDQLVFIDILSGLSKNPSEKELKELDKIPKSIKKLIEPEMDTESLKKKSIILGIIYLLNTILGYAEGIIMAYVGIGYSKKLRKDISKKINKLPLKYFDSHETGDILSRVTNDVDNIGINMSNEITSLATNITLFLGSIVMMIITNWIMALTAILSSIIGFIISFILLKKSQKYFVIRQKELGELNGHIEEIYSGHNVVKAYNGEEAALKEFDTINDKLYNSNRKSQFLSGIMQPIMMFIGNFGYVAICIVGALLVIHGKTSFGVIVAFMIYVRLFTAPLSRIAQAMTTLQSIVASAERVFEFTDEEELKDESNLTEKVNKEDIQGNIDFNNIKFGYNEDKIIIKNFNANIKRGQKIALVGPTGAGKTTIVNLLMKFYEVNEGNILIDGKSISELKRENVHNLFTMVLQDTWLFDGTIRDNIKYNRKDVSDERIWEICKTVGIDHFIRTLPGGLDSKVGEGSNISSGERQLLTIARGMVEDAPLLILDEATSNVDTRTEELVQKAMDKLTVGKTSFIIAHRLSTIKNADLILVINEGNIIEQGTHSELMKKNGFYADLYNSQFKL
ncbi:MAG: ABC transporter ATP-binding protein [Bacilli bacterium]|nr:ABC transporter ATP-binding protein [Bacilli bacterium]